MTTYPLPTGTIEACVRAAQSTANDHGAELALRVGSPAEVAASINHDRRGEAWAGIVRAVAAVLIDHLRAAGVSVEHAERPSEEQP